MKRWLLAQCVARGLPLEHSLLIELKLVKPFLTHASVRVVQELHGAWITIRIRIVEAFHQSSLDDLGHLGLPWNGRVSLAMSKKRAMMEMETGDS